MSRALLSLLALLFCLPALAALDPTQPPQGHIAAPADAVETLQLQAISRGSHGQRAVINGQSLKVGEQLGSSRLKAIYPRAVLIERQGQQELLRLAEPIVKPSR